jgi:D-alanyl-lipoteichoic acid acyltransferase DltB (MBOAT superfamily)
MIQRIQSLFLVLTAGVFGTLFKLPFAISDKPSAQFLADKVFDITDHPVLLGLAILGAVLALVSIFMFKNRKLQLKLGYLIIIMAILLPAVAFLLFTKESASIDPTVQVFDQAGIFLPLGAILFASLANYFIRKDDKLVKSMDRLR